MKRDMDWRCRLGLHKWLLLQEDLDTKIYQCKRCLEEAMELKDG